MLTSGNLSDEPICYDDDDAFRRLAGIADAFLTHDRPIHVPCDDSVVRVVDGRELPVRRSRGFAPLPVHLGAPVRPVLAVGGELKNTFCVTRGPYAFCSPHLGDMGSLETLTAFERAVGHLTGLYEVTPEVLGVDAHPLYSTRAWARRAGGPRVDIQHHHAHVASLLAEHGRVGRPVIGVAFDGTGYGSDGAIWGGEVLLVEEDITRFTRVGHLRPIPLPGGDAAVRHPWRVALAHLAAAGLPWDDDLPPVSTQDPAQVRLLRAQLDKGFACVPCTSMGRLFDAVSSLLGIRHAISYEAQAAIELEAAAFPMSGGAPSCTPDVSKGTLLTFAVDDDGVIDPTPVLAGLIGGWRDGAPVGMLADAFHDAVARAVTELASTVERRTGVTTVGLTGGVFQNVRLLRSCRAHLTAAGFEVLIHRVVPANDGGLALGQAVVASARSERASEPRSREQRQAQPPTTIGRSDGMCLGIPGRILDIWSDRGTRMAHVDFGGAIKDVCVAYLPGIGVGDYTIVHAGFALTRLDEESARATLKMFEELGVLAEELGTAKLAEARQP